MLFKAYCEQADPAVTTIQEAISEANLDAFKVWVATYSKKDKPEGFCRKPSPSGTQSNGSNTWSSGVGANDC